MTIYRTFVAVAALVFLTGSAVAQALTVERGYLLVTGPMAKAAAAYLEIHNTGSADDRLIAARSDAAQIVQLHGNTATADGVMSMRALDAGLDIPAGGIGVLARGGDHLMFMGLTRALNKGDTIELVLTFAVAGEITVEIPVNPDE